MNPKIIVPTRSNVRSVPEDPDEPTPVEGPVEGQEIDDRTGATDAQVGDRTGPGVGYDQEPEQEKDKGGVTSS